LLFACGGSREPSTHEAAESGDAGAPGNSGLLRYDCRGSERSSAEPAAAQAVTALRDTGRRVGVALSSARLREADYAAAAAREFNAATPENEMKWDALEPSPGQFTFAAANGIVEFARDNQMTVRGHTLVWHSQLPAWVHALVGPDAVREAMARHIEAVVTHFKDTYPGSVVAWDVVNEALDSQAGEVVFRDSIFYRELGEAFIGEAFELARRADPDAQLFYNDFGIEGLGAKANAAYELVRRLVESGVPIDGVGLQMHTGIDDRGPSHDELRQNIERYAALGLVVHITEMDVNLCLVSNGDFALEAQRFRFNRILHTCVETSGCESVALWGVTDASSWLNDVELCREAPYQPMPLALDAAYAKKPAWWGIYDALTGCFYE